MEELNNSESTNYTSEFNNDPVDTEINKLISETSAPQAPVKEEVKPAFDPNSFEDELPWRGQKKKFPYPKIKALAQKGYDYSQKMHEVSLREQGLASREQELAGLAEYKKVDEWAKNNQDLYNQIVNAYSQNQTTAANDPVQQKLSSLETTIKSMNDYITKQQELEKATKIQKEDEELQVSVEDTKKEFSQFGWDQTDQASGLKMEDRVIQYAASKGINSFRAAFLDLFYGDLMKRQETKGREVAKEEIQKQHKMGLVKTSPSPRQSISKSVDVRGLNYDQIADEISRVYNIN